MPTSSDIFKPNIQLNVSGEAFNIEASINDTVFDNSTYLFNSRLHSDTLVFIKIVDKKFSATNLLEFEDLNQINDGIYEVICIYAPKRGKAILGEVMATPGDFVHVGGFLHIINGSELESTQVDLFNIESYLETVTYNKLQVVRAKVAIMPCSYDRYIKELKHVSEALLDREDVSLIEESEECTCKCDCKISELPVRIAAYNLLKDNNFIVNDEHYSELFNIFSYDECCSCCDLNESDKEDTEECISCKDCEENSFIFEAQKDAEIIMLNIPETQSFGSHKGIANLSSLEIQIEALSGGTIFNIYYSEYYDEVFDASTGLFNKKEFIESLYYATDPDHHGFKIVEIIDNKKLSIKRNEFDTTYYLNKFMVIFSIRKGEDINKYISAFDNDLITIKKNIKIETHTDATYNKVTVEYIGYNDGLPFDYYLEEEGGDVLITNDIVYDQVAFSQSSKFGTWKGKTNAKTYKVVDFEGNVLAIKPISKQ